MDGKQPSSYGNPLTPQPYTQLSYMPAKAYRLR